MTNFEKILENDKERIIEVIAEKCCIAQCEFMVEQLVQYEGVKND